MNRLERILERMGFQIESENEIGYNEIWVCNGEQSYKIVGRSHGEQISQNSSMGGYTYTHTTYTVYVCGTRYFKKLASYDSCLQFIIDEEC